MVHQEVLMRDKSNKESKIYLHQDTLNENG